MPLSISDFSAITELSPQTLRYYHAEGLLVPAEVEDQTGYRSYRFEQVQQAVLVTALRGAGISVRDIRDALESPDRLPALLEEQRVALDRRRAQEDAALESASVLVTGWPQIRREEVPAVDVVTVHVAVRGGSQSPRQVVPDHVVAAARDLWTSLQQRGGRVLGSPWCTYRLGTPEQKAKIFSPDGPEWECAVAVTGAEESDLPAGAEPSTSPARQQLCLRLPGRQTTVIYAAAVDHLVRHCLQHGLVPDIARPRHVLHDDGMDIAVEVWPNGDHPSLGEPGAH